MILLNQDGEIIRIDSWEDMIDRPAFTYDLRSSDIKLKAVIGRYNLPDEFFCGLADCHSHHKKGYLILTEDGRETNLGHLCGAREFGLDFTTMAQTLDRLIDATENRESLHEIQSRVETYINEVSEVCKVHDVHKLHKNLKQLTTKRSRFPRRLPETIRSMVKNKDSVVRIEVEASNDEIQILEQMQGEEIDRPHYLTKEAGNIVGLEALYPNNDFIHILNNDLLPNLHDLKEFDIDSGSDLEVRNKLLWARDIESKIKIAKVAISKAKQLLTTENLMQLYPVIDGQKGCDVFRDFCNYTLAKA